MRQRRSGQSSINVLSGLFYVIKVIACLFVDMVREPWPMGKVSPPATDAGLADVGLSNPRPEP